MGDFETGAMKDQISWALEAMPAGSAFDRKLAALPALETARLLLIDKPDATQTYFIIGQPGIARAHPDRVALWRVNTLFGDRFTSMLNEELRVNTGLTYGAGSRVQLDRLTGAITIDTFTKTETTVEAMDLALEVLKRLREKGISRDQLSSAKAYVKGIYPTERLETQEQLAGLLGELALHELSRGDVDDLSSKVDSVTVEQVNAAARKYYQSEHSQFCLVGNAAKIREKVGKYAKEVKIIKAETAGVRVE